MQHLSTMLQQQLVEHVDGEAEADEELIFVDLCEVIRNWRFQLYRVATAQGKQGIWFLLFPDRENREFCSDTGKNLLTQGKYLDCDYKHKKYVYIFKFQKFLASLRSA